jgi:hypothetical protein
MYPPFIPPPPPPPSEQRNALTNVRALALLPRTRQLLLADNAIGADEWVHTRAALKCMRALEELTLTVRPREGREGRDGRLMSGRLRLERQTFCIETSGLAWLELS